MREAAEWRQLQGKFTCNVNNHILIGIVITKQKQHLTTTLLAWGGEMGGSGWEVGRGGG
jgi:hypothetical protein